MKKLVIGSALAVGSASSFADVPVAVTTALASIQVDAISVATVVLLAIVAIYAFKFIRKGL